MLRYYQFSGFDLFQKPVRLAVETRKVRHCNSSELLQSKHQVPSKPFQDCWPRSLLGVTPLVPILSLPAAPLVQLCLVTGPMGCRPWRPAAPRTLATALILLTSSSIRASARSFSASCFLSAAVSGEGEWAPLGSIAFITYGGEELET